MEEIILLGRTSNGIESDAFKQLVAALNTLMDTNFNGLINLLYRIDVDEEKIKSLPFFDANLIALLIVERLQKKTKPI